MDFQGNLRTYPAPEGLYSAQELVEDAQEFAEVPRDLLRDGYHPDSVRMRYLDALTGNTDRRPNNWLVDRTGKPDAIDNGLGFRGGRVLPDQDYLPGLDGYGAIPPGQRRRFLEQSREYAHEASARLTDSALEAMVDRLRPLPEYRHLDFDEILNALKANRDAILNLIEGQLRRVP